LLFINTYDSTADYFKALIFCEAGGCAKITLRGSGFGLCSACAGLPGGLLQKRFPMADDPFRNVTFLMAKPPEPPPELGVYGAKLWRSIAREWNVDGAGAQAILLQACQAADRAESMRQQIEASGSTVAAGRNGHKANPLIMPEIAARALVARLLARLGVLDSGEKRSPGRPPKWGR
jgi:hypothetical protein